MTDLKKKKKVPVNLKNIPYVSAYPTFQVYTEYIHWDRMNS